LFVLDWLGLDWLGAVFWLVGIIWFGVGLAGMDYIINGFGYSWIITRWLR